MNRCLILSLVIALSAVTAVPHKVIPKKHDGRIIGGKRVSIEDFPYQVSLHKSKSFFTCGGSIIGKNYILTAAHCADYLVGGFARAGANQTKYGGTKHRIVDIHKHENFTFSNRGMMNDIALLKVDPEFKYGPTRGVIKLQNSSSNYINLEDGDLTTVTGYGAIKANGPLSVFLMAVDVPIVNNRKCSKIYQAQLYDEILDDRFCAGFLEGKKDSCQGDSGGPVVRDGYQVGVVSYGYGCALPHFPGIYTNVLQYSKWIEDYIRKKEDA